jgi:hypothetical protein
LKREEVISNYLYNREKGKKFSTNVLKVNPRIDFGKVLEGEG